MADYGLRIRNQNNILQIDGNYSNMYLYAKVLYSSGTTVNNVPNNPITSAGTQNLKKFTVPKSAFAGGVNVAVSLHNGYCTCFGGIFSNGNNYDIYVYICTYLNSSGTGNAQPSNATLYIFGTFPKNRISSDNYGLIVRNSANEVVFDSNFKLLKIHDNLSSLIGAGGQRYYYDGNLTNKALLFQGTEATLDLGYVQYQEGDYSEIDDAYQVKGYYVFQNNKILSSLAGDAIDNQNYAMDYLQSRRTYGGGGSPPNGKSYYINAPLPLLIDTTYL